MYGLDDNNYMSCRKQSTIVNGSCSPQEKIPYGTAQGSILGSLIFILYVNNIFMSRKLNCPVTLFATVWWDLDFPLFMLIWTT